MTAVDPAQATREAWERVWDALSTARGVVVNSPPGAGKSTGTRETARRALPRTGQVPIVVQTNEQADDMVVDFLSEANGKTGSVLVGRLHGQDYCPPGRLTADPRIVTSTDIRRLLFGHRLFCGFRLVLGLVELRDQVNDDGIYRAKYFA